MHKYIAKRLLLMIPVIVGISFIIFSIMSFMPGQSGPSDSGGESDG